MLRQLQKTASLLLPRTGHSLSIPQAAGQVSTAALAQQGVELGVVLHLGQGHEEVAASVADQVLDQPLLVTLARPAVVALEQVVGAEGDEILLFLAPWPA